jgi:hypothetical protein
MHENRETSLASAQADRSGKANNHKPDMNAREESDCAVVPVKRPNKEASVSAEVVEGRAQTKENDAGPNTSPTRSGERVSQGLGGVRQVAREKEAGTVHGSAAPSERSITTGKLLRPEAERGPGSRRREVGRV